MILSLAEDSTAALNEPTCFKPGGEAASPGIPLGWVMHPAATPGLGLRWPPLGARFWSHRDLTLPHASWFLIAINILYLSFSIFKWGQTYSPGCSKDLGK